jgi:two-component system cell cycle response regulator DivK
MNKILVVDDNRDNQELLIRRLEHSGSFEIFVASNGKEALEVASSAKPDLVLMDLRMPVMDGYEATRALHDTEWGRNLPVIAVTALASKEHREKALDAGCCDFIPKPILDYALVEKKIRTFLAPRLAPLPS